MTTVWTVIVAVSVANFVIKAAGPVVVGGRPLPARMTAVIALLAPALLAGLVFADTFGSDAEFTADAKIVGVGAAALAIVLRAPFLVVVAVAAIVTALVRAFS